jgi:hypothetical protein
MPAAAAVAATRCMPCEGGRQSAHDAVDHLDVAIDERTRRRRAPQRRQDFGVSEFGECGFVQLRSCSRRRRDQLGPERRDRVVQNSSTS